MTDRVCNQDHPESRAQRRTLWGIVLMVVGSALLAHKYGWYSLSDWIDPQTDWGHFWPLVFVLSGVIYLVTARRRGQVGHGLFMIALGAWMVACFEHYAGLSFANSWPVMLIAFGVQILFFGGVRRHRRNGSRENV